MYLSHAFYFRTEAAAYEIYENMHTKLFWIYSIVFVATVSSQSEIGERNALAMSLLKVSEFTGNRNMRSVIMLKYIFSLIVVFNVLSKLQF